jgi:hypothetical protein
MSSNANRSHTNPSHITFLTDQAKTDHQEAVQNAMGSLQTSGNDQTLSSIQQVGSYGWNGTNWERTQVDSNGDLKVVMSGGGGDASASNQLTMISSLSTIEGDTTSLDAKITACNTGAVVVSSSVLPTGGSTATLQTSGNATLTAIEASHYAEGDTIAAADTGVLIMGRNGTNVAKPIHITNDGDVEVEIADFVKGQALMASSFPVVISSDQSTLNVKQKESENLGSANNLANNTTLNSGATSSAVNVSNMRVSNLVYEDTSTASADGLDIDISVDGGTSYHESFGSLYPSLNIAGTKRVATYMNLNLSGITNLRIRNTSTTDNYTNVYATIVGSP